jgi:uncharacterized protein (UPF0216 family)
LDIPSVVSYFKRYKYPTGFTILPKTILKDLRNYFKEERPKVYLFEGQHHFVKIRHYGFLQNRNKQTRLAAIRESLQLEPARPVIKITVAQRMLEKFGKDIFKCPCCENGRLVLVKTIRPKEDFQIKEGVLNKASPSTPGLN